MDSEVSEVPLVDQYVLRVYPHETDPGGTKLLVVATNHGEPLGSSIVTLVSYDIISYETLHSLLFARPSVIYW